VAWERELRLKSFESRQSHQFECRLALREAIVELRLTDSFRLIHGASDRWPGVYVDKLGEFMLVQSESLLETGVLARVETLARQVNARGVYHKMLNRRMQATTPREASPQLVFGENAPDRFAIRENGLNFELGFNEGYSVGLFLDQRDNRRRFLVNYIADEFSFFIDGTRGKEVLNTFAYTCGFSVAAGRAGMQVTSIDLSKRYLEWGKCNFVRNGLDPASHEFIYGDVFDWMRRLAKKQRLFDCVVLDPPTFSQSKIGGTWRAEKDYQRLVALALSLLKRGGVLLACTNAANFLPEAFLSVIQGAVTASSRRIIQRHFVPQPPDFPITRDEPGYLKTVWLRIQ
jgi:23S rRNA (cytosine1962-C5)-methyltransferase